MPMLHVLIKLVDNILIVNSNSQSQEAMLDGIRNLLYLNLMGSETLQIKCGSISHLTFTILSVFLQISKL